MLLVICHYIMSLLGREPFLGNMPTFQPEAHTQQYAHISAYGPHSTHAHTFGSCTRIRLLRLYSAITHVFGSFICFQLLHLYSAHSSVFDDYICIRLFWLLHLYSAIMSYWAHSHVFSCHAYIQLLRLQIAVCLHSITSHSIVSHSIVRSFSSKSSAQINPTLTPKQYDDQRSLYNHHSSKGIY